ncbi:MAG: heme peroxidase [Proteobacteria bacterium]|nr:heme peroxidase [Pseudomonadota bacterium]
MFRTLPAATFADDDLRALATEMTATPEDGVTPETEADDEENFGIPAGYTYFGQFVDHDITFDPTSSLDKQNDPDALVDFRTPRLDLDSLYGRGPDDQPYLYQPDGMLMALGGDLHGGEPDHVVTRDLPRFRGRALIGDKRNDENVIVSQLQGLFLRFHNAMATAKENAGLSFAEIQRIVRWHYQWLVLYDYLPRIVGRAQVEAVLPHLKGDKSILEVPPQLRFYRWHADPFMPVEFSGAAYRFGHSMVRPVYRLSAQDLPESGPRTTKGLGGRKMIFDPNPDNGLNGFREFPRQWGIDWRLFFETRGGRPLSPKNLGKARVQPAYKIDTSLVSPLGALPEFSRPGRDTPLNGQINVLALRNLKRGMALGLPSGQAVAELMGLEPIPDAALVVGKANVDGLKTNKPITAFGKSFIGNAPLWFYVLAEAQHHWKLAAARQQGKSAKNSVHVRLGPVGGRIVAEVLVGLVLGDQNSFLNQAPRWQPALGNPRANSVFDRFTVGDLAMEVGTPRAGE